MTCSQTQAFFLICVINNKRRSLRLRPLLPCCGFERGDVRQSLRPSLYSLFSTGVARDKNAASRPRGLDTRWCLVAVCLSCHIISIFPKELKAEGVLIFMSSCLWQQQQQQQQPELVVSVAALVQSTFFLVNLPTFLPTFKSLLLTLTFPFNQFIWI